MDGRFRRGGRVCLIGEPAWVTSGGARTRRGTDVDCAVRRLRHSCHGQSKSFEAYTSFVNNFDRASHYARKIGTLEAFQKFLQVPW